MSSADSGPLGRGGGPSATSGGVAAPQSGEDVAGESAQGSRDLHPAPASVAGSAPLSLSAPSRPASLSEPPLISGVAEDDTLLPAA